MVPTTEILLERAGEIDFQILTAVEVARFLRVPKSTVYKMVRRGQLPGQKIGKHWRFMRQGIQSWLDGRMVSPSVVD